MKITVWTTSNCVQCTQTKKQFDLLGIGYEEKSLEDNPDQLEIFKTLGFFQAPVVTTDIKTWAGFRIDKIRSLSAFLLREK